MEVVMTTEVIRRPKLQSKCLDSQPTATELFQSPLFGSGTVFCSTSHPRRHLSSALAWRHTSSNGAIHKTFVVPAKWHRHFGHVNRFTYLLTINIPTPSVFTGRMPFLLPNQQCESTEGTSYVCKCLKCFAVRHKIKHFVVIMAGKQMNWSNKSLPPPSAW